ncbi:hypothetical protein [Kitasatospora sp. NPDC001132]
MTRAEAMQIAILHVEKLSTSQRGYQDGVKLAERVAAVERIARFLIGEDDD